jgi:hypothetical protein
VSIVTRLFAEQRGEIIFGFKEKLRDFLSIF